MKIFFSWSGNQAQQIAAVLREWLPGVLQAVRPYFSPDDLKAGSRWSPEIASQLEACAMGVIIVTAENKHAPWLMFEAGAISKKVAEASVCPILFGLKTVDLDGPLAQFQAVHFSKEEIERVVSTMNEKLGDARLESSVLKTVFEKFWPDLENKIGVVIAAKRETRGLPKSRGDRELLEEMLSLLRNLSRGPGIRSLREREFLRERELRDDRLGSFSLIIDLILQTLDLVERIVLKHYQPDLIRPTEAILRLIPELCSNPDIRGQLHAIAPDWGARIRLLDSVLGSRETSYRRRLGNALINSSNEEPGQQNE